MKQNLTIRQKKLVSLLKQELLKTNGAKSMAELMILAGYSEKTARLPSEKVLNNPAVQDATKDFINKLEEKANMALNAITPDKLKSSTARDNTYITDIMIKNKQLLSGKATENKMIIQVEISKEIMQKNMPAQATPVDPTPNAPA